MGKHVAAPKEKNLRTGSGKGSSDQDHRTGSGGRSPDPGNADRGSGQRLSSYVLV